MLRELPKKDTELPKKDIRKSEDPDKLQKFRKDAEREEEAKQIYRIIVHERLYTKEDVSRMTEDFLKSVEHISKPDTNDDIRDTPHQNDFAFDRHSPKQAKKQLQVIS